MDVVIKPGRTYRYGTSKKKGGETVTRTRDYGPGDVVELPESEAARLFGMGAAARADSAEGNAAKGKADRIPADFPGAEALAEAGIETFSVLADFGEARDLVELDGIGEATAGKIVAKLSGE